MKKLLMLLLITTITSTTIYAKRTKTKTIEYTVQSGDTLSAIAVKHKTTTAKIREKNGLQSNDLIKVGQTLKIPMNSFAQVAKKQISKKTKKQLKKGLVDYTIQRGDTLYTIARKHKTTTKEVREANGMEYNAMIRVGQVIKVPTNTYFPDKNSDKKASATKKIGTKKDKGIYEVKSGDTLFSIAKKNKVTIKELMTLNDIKAGSVIKVGQKLKVSKKSSFIPSEADNKKDRTVVKKYKTKKGDTLYRVAKRHGITIKQLKQLNARLKKVKDPKSRLKPNMVLAVSKSTTKKAIIKKYKTKKGDTLYKIAKRHGITIKQLKQLNARLKKVKDPKSRLKPNMVLAVGKTKRDPSRQKIKTYKVKKGDTLWLVAKKHNTTVKKLRALNKLSRRAKLYRGMVLKVDDDPKKAKVKTPEYRVAKAKKKRSIKSSKKRKTVKVASRKSNRSSNKRLSDALALLNGRSSKSSRYTSSNAKVVRTAKKFLGTRYVWGATGPNKFDCSGFTQYVLRKTKGIRIPRVSRKQAYYGKYVSRSNLRSGDLVFFDTSRRRRGYVNHVGIYIGNNKFIHASSGKRRVVITSLNRPFYSARFKWGRRVN